MDPQIYDVGEYQMAPELVVTVSKKGGKLMAQWTGKPDFELLPESQIGFFIKDLSALFFFLRGETVKLNQFITIQDGQIIAAKRIN